MKSVLSFFGIMLLSGSSFAFSKMVCSAEIKSSQVGVPALTQFTQSAPGISNVRNGSLMAGTKVNETPGQRQYTALVISPVELNSNMGAQFNLTGRLIGQDMNVAVQIAKASTSVIQVRMQDLVSKQTYSANLNVPADDGATMKLENQRGVRLEMTCYFQR